MTVLLDASALLAFLQDEPGSDAVEEVLDDAAMSSVNFSEVATRIAARGLDPRPILEELLEFPLDILDVTFVTAMRLLDLHAQERQLGVRLSLGDRCCLATAWEERLPVLTADREWRHFDGIIDVRLIR